MLQFVMALWLWPSRKKVGSKKWRGCHNREFGMAVFGGFEGGTITLGVFWGIWG